ncbi:MAG: PepSY-like domain-containing protein [Bacteroidales bacterium]|nr:PepSY-like domain-containing protein [Bacteroidales bacterium]
MKKLLFLLIAVIISTASAHAFIDSYSINRDKLPEEAQQMLTEYFPKAKVSLIKIDRHLLKKTDFDVRLTNGTTIEFTNKGKWTSVDCGSKAVPESLVPKTIRNYVAKNFSGVAIVSIRKRNAGYDIGLSDQVMLRFNLLGQFKGVSMEDE